MNRKLLMGNEAIALGAMRAGVNVVCGYPGTPSTEILETVARHNDGSVYVEWSVNEKAAMEVAAGAAYAGARAMVTMKMVGLNVASDPLMSLNYVGVLGGLVVVVADDPGPISSQTEQDTRHFAKFAKLAVFDPSTPEEAYEMVAEAFDFSEKYGAPVILRPTTRICHSRSSVETLGDLPARKPIGFVKSDRWVIFPKLSYARKIVIEENIVKMREDLSDYARNSLTGEGVLGVASGGVSCAYAREALADMSGKYKLLKVSAFPFPERLAFSFLKGLKEALVIEELDPVIEDELVRLCGLYNLNVKIKGKRTGHIRNAGENTVESAAEALSDFFRKSSGTPKPPPADFPLPARPPVLCAGCPHRASFFAVKEATKKIKAVYTGDIGCYTLGNAKPLETVDTCLCMGGGITVAQGLRRIEPDTAHFAFIGDSTFFHAGITGLINAIYNQTDMIAVILDNSTTAMTGNQPHPGTGETMMGKKSEKISIERIVNALGPSMCIKVNPFDQKAAGEAVRAAIEAKGVRAIIFEAPCVTFLKSKNAAFVNAAECNGCKVCVNKLGCPALNFENGKARIDGVLCAGCGLCAGLCRAKAVKMAKPAGEGAHR